MFTAKPKALSLSLILYATLALLLATSSDAKEYAPAHIHRREHFNLNRLIRKRAPPTDNGGIIATQTGSTAANTQSLPASAASSTQSARTQAPSNAASATPSPSASANNPLLSVILSSLTNPATPTSSSASGALSLVSSSSPSPSSSSSTSSSASPVTTSQAPTVVASSSPTTTPISIARTTITTDASEASATASSAPSSSSSAKITRTTLTVLIVIAACVGGTAIIWTIIRKWKFRASSQFEDRMRPIDWQPTTSDDDSGLPIHRRAGSSASSFHSGSGHEGLGGGYGSTSDHGHGRSVSPLPPLPDHDFTAPPVSLAPVGGYADLARGPSPQPQMHEALTRGPSMTRPQYDQYGVPLHHQGGYGTQDAYDYNGSARY